MENLNLLSLVQYAMSPSRETNCINIRTIHVKSKYPPLVESTPLSIVASTAKNVKSPAGFRFGGRRYAQV